MDDTPLARIQLVTRRYHELKGLTSAILGSVFCLLAAGASLNPPTVYYWVCVPALIAAAIAGSYWLEHRYYAARFGRVRHADEPDKWQVLFILAISIITLVDSKSLGKGLPAILPLLIVFRSAWIIVRDWPLRTYHLITVAAGIVSSLLYVRAAPQSQADWFVAAGMLFGMALIITGVGDHRLLVLALQSSVSDAENEQSI